MSIRLQWPYFLLNVKTTVTTIACYHTHLKEGKGNAFTLSVYTQWGGYPIYIAKYFHWSHVLCHWKYPSPRQGRGALGYPWQDRIQYPPPEQNGVPPCPGQDEVAPIQDRMGYPQPWEGQVRMGYPPPSLDRLKHGRYTSLSVNVSARHKRDTVQ